MTGNDERPFLRHNTKIAVTIHKDNEKTLATMVDVSEGAIGIISDRGILPGTKVNVSLKYIDDYLISGTVKSANLINHYDKTRYRIGIEADHILIESEYDTTESPTRAEFLKRIISAPAK